MSEVDSHPAMIISDLLAAALQAPLTDGTWANAKFLYGWERRGLDYLHALKVAGTRPPINAWTAMIVDEGYPAAKAGAAQGKYWSPPKEGRLP